ncbi:MAG: dihydrofolate reductase family protein [Methanomassiliicoccus sp.]|nr:dihydrofolate reductase family protein [Methanomassiliicoccus sp.]
MLPYLVIHNAVSVDGRMDRLDVDMELYYSLISTWKEDLTLCGSETMMRSGIEMWEHDGSTDPSRPLLAVVDSRGRFRSWGRAVPSMYWRAGVALCSELTPREHLEYLRKEGVEVMVAGRDKVDLRAALEMLSEKHAVKVIRVDSGGTLNGVLLQAGLVSEVSVMVQPQLIGGASPSSLFQVPDLPPGERGLKAELISSRELKGGAVWLRYRVLR